MEDFVETITDEVAQDKLWSALRQRHPFSAFNKMLHYTDQRENWFAFRDKRMRLIVERWMEDEGIVYKDGLFTCDSGSVLEYFDEDDV